MVDYQTALRCARFSQEVYQDFVDIQFSESSKTEMALVESGKSSGVDTQVALLYDAEPNLLFIVFRVTDKSVDWITNLKLRQKIYPYGDEDDTEVRFHRGFMDAYFSVRDRLLDNIRTFPEAKLRFAGHSLGGALATIAALDTQYNITQHNNQNLDQILLTITSKKIELEMRGWSHIVAN